MADDQKDIKKFIEEKKAVIGKDRTMKELRLAKLSRVYLASNAPADLKEAVEHYAKLNKAKVIELKINNEDLGVLCRKSFFISVLGVLK